MWAAHEGVDRQLHAAHDLGIPHSTTIQVVKQLEEGWGVLLLQRTIRTVRPTLDGEAQPPLLRDPGRYRGRRGRIPQRDPARQQLELSIRTRVLPPGNFLTRARQLPAGSLATRKI
jgi:hypothetical protein